MSDLISKALHAVRESKSIEFKESFDIASQGAWCELIKDVIAIANSGGGVILIGVDNRGQSTGYDVTPILAVDSADITNRIFKYTGIQFSDFEVLEQCKGASKIAVFKVEGASIPIVFTKPGTYDIGGGKQKTAFGIGTLYFRHGAKSEPGNTDDIRKAIERQLESVRKQWVRGVRKVVTAPRGSEVIVAGKDVRESHSPSARPIRLVEDPSAPAYRKIDPNVTHPHRLKDVVQKLNRDLDGKVTLRLYDLLCLRRLYNLDSNSQFCYKPKFGPMQYSDAFIDWVTDKYSKDPRFFEKSRKECSDRKYELKLSGIGKRKY